VTDLDFAHQALQILSETMILGNCVYRNFENSVCSVGTKMHCARPGSFRVKPRRPDDVISFADIDENRFVVVLDKVFKAEMILNAEECKLPWDLIVREHLRPKIAAMALDVDFAILTLMSNCGPLVVPTILDARSDLNAQRAYATNRFLIVNDVSWIDGKNATSNRYYGFDTFHHKDYPVNVAGQREAVMLAIRPMVGSVCGNDLAISVTSKVVDSTLVVNFFMFGGLYKMQDHFVFLEKEPNVRSGTA
jgi:hypothetical protein